MGRITVKILADQMHSLELRVKELEERVAPLTTVNRAVEVRPTVEESATDEPVVQEVESTFVERESKSVEFEPDAPPSTFASDEPVNPPVDGE
jgi:hypothetical protein